LRWQQPNLLRPLRMGYGALAGRGDRLPLLCVSPCGTLSWRRLECQDALPLPVAVVACTSAIRALLAFSIGHDPDHNFLLKRGCCRFAQAVGITSDPRITFPYLLKICASKLGLWAPAGSRTATASLDVPPSSSASAPRSNPRRARRTVVAPPLAISSIGGFRTPAVGACGLGRRAGVRKPSHRTKSLPR
jgi:hypothetical protein